MDIGHMRSVPAQEAWPHEARDFTPWLANNLTILGEEIGVGLEAVDSEVRVGRYFADIVAQTSDDGSVVLIENQLGKADHGHLGQLLTYVAGTDASIVIWIATEFSDPHLAAIKWFNENTVEPFSFFAVRLRVVRIGDSLPAPVFEVLERPNEWERRFKSERRTSGTGWGLADQRQEFWSRVAASRPDFESRGLTLNASASQWLIPDGVDDIVVSAYVATGGVGVFLRGLRGSTPGDFAARFNPKQVEFRNHVSSDFGASTETAHPSTTLKIDMKEHANWEKAIAWLCDRVDEWLEATSKVFGDAQT